MAKVGRLRAWGVRCQGGWLGECWLVLSAEGHADELTATPGDRTITGGFGRQIHSVCGSFITSKSLLTPIQERWQRSERGQLRLMA